MTERRKAIDVAERLTNGVEVLAVGNTDIRVRLHSASINILPLRPIDFPDSLQAEFEWIRGALSSFADRPMLNDLDEALILAGRIFDLFRTVLGKIRNLDS